RQRSVHRRDLHHQSRQGRDRPRRRHRRRDGAATVRRRALMAEQFSGLFERPGVRIGGAVLLVALLVLGVWPWVTAGRESTDDAQVDAHVTPIAARVGGTVLRVGVKDNQAVDAGVLLVELDPRDYQVAVDKARAELADAEAAVLVARTNVPITSTTAASGVT